MKSSHRARCVGGAQLVSVPHFPVSPHPEVVGCQDESAQLPLLGPEKGLTGQGKSQTNQPVTNVNITRNETVTSHTSRCDTLR